MKKIILTSLVAMFATISANAAATPYASLKLGYIASSEADYKINANKAADQDEASQTQEALSGMNLSIAGGASFNMSELIALRAELEYSFGAVSGKSHPSDTIDTDFTDSKLLVNGYVDFGGKKWGGFNPYVGLHLGYGMGTMKDFHPEDTDVSGFVYGASVGASYAISEKFALDLGFRYMMTAYDWELDYDGYTFEGEYSPTEMAVNLGARYSF